MSNQICSQLDSISMESPKAHVVQTIFMVILTMQVHNHAHRLHTELKRKQKLYLLLQDSEGPQPF